jgi:hypothetical protein
MGFSIRWSLFQVFALLVNIVFEASAYGFVGAKEELFAEIVVIAIFGIIGSCHIILFSMQMKAQTAQAGASQVVYTENAMASSILGSELHKL